MEDTHFAWARVWTIPLPIVPEPITETFILSISFHAFIRRSGLAGLPKTVVKGSMFFVTTAPIPAKAPSPIIIGRSGVPSLIIAPEPM